MICNMTEELQTHLFMYLFSLVNALNSNYHSVQEHKQQKMKCSELFVLFPTLARCDTRVALALREKETQVK